MRPLTGRAATRDPVREASHRRADAPQHAGPVEGDRTAGRSNMFKVGMKDAPCKDPLHCLLGCPLGCICVGNCYMRHKVLEGNMDAYLCCQGYYDKACWKAGSVGDQGNPCCLACEGCCCA